MEKNVVIAVSGDRRRMLLLPASSPLAVEPDFPKIRNLERWIRDHEF
jgi:hypothetical protein